MKRNALPLAVFLGIVLGGSIVRLLAINHELGIDEVWSMQFALGLRRWTDVFFIHWDNNHYLNTLWLWMVGGRQPFWVYHLPSFLSGVALLIVVSAWAYRRNAWEGCIIALLLADSYLFARYSVEARGFMPMLLCAFLAFVVMERFLRTRKTGDAVLFWALSIAAFLWHLTFLEWYAVLLVRSAWQLRHTQPHRWLQESALLHLPILLFCAWLYAVDLRWMHLGGVTYQFTIGEMTVGGLAMLLGTERTWGPQTWEAWSVGSAALLSLVWLLRQRLRTWVAQPMMRIVLWTTGIPGVLLIFLIRSILSPRLFLPLLFLLLLWIAARLRAGLEMGGRPRAVAAIVLIAMYIGNALQLSAFVPEGLGHYQQTLTYILTHEPARHISIGTHRSWRSTEFLGFLLTRTTMEKPVIFVDGTGAQLPRTWLVLESAEPHPPEVSVDGGRYRRMDDAWRSGNFWVLYHVTP